MQRSMIRGGGLLAGLWLALGAGAQAQTYSRTEKITYYDNTSSWMLGQVASATCTVSVPASTACDGDVMSSATFDSTTALQLTASSFGKLQQTLTYDTTSAVATGQRGTLKTLADGNNNVTTFTDWKRGIPQKITFADTKFKSALVNNIGEIDWVEDETRSRTCYDYDGMGRVILVTYPSETTASVCNNAAWGSTHIEFGPRNVTEYGLSPGHWRQWVWTGNGHKLTYYDALWRPRLVREYDSNDEDGTIRSLLYCYDAEGRQTYASYAKGAVSSVSCALTGTRTGYDAIGRVKSVEQDSELGVLVTTTSYLSNADGPYTVVTNPRGFQTRTWFQAYDQPSYDTPVEIWHPEATRTVIDRDAFGKPKTLTRRNDAGTVSLTRSYTYLSTQELCRMIEPETGATDFGYDGAGNLKWSATGLPTNIGCDLDGEHSQITPRRVDRTYDVRNRLKTLEFPDGLGDQVWIYTPDGLTDSIVTQNGGGNIVTNSYTYFRRGLPKGERLQWGSVDWSLDYTYNANGHLASQSQPLEPSVSFAPNALGQPTQVGAFATGATYHPNGAIKQFTYGNLIVHNMVQNARGLPETSRDTYGPAKLDDAYDYDQNGNVAAITDALTGNRGNRDMTYDGLDRLKTAVSPMFGNAAYAYDALDNLTRVTIGGTAARDHYYCYDAYNQLTNIKTGSCAGTSVIGLGYDLQGNLINKNGASATFAFDFGNRLRTTSIGASSYVYDGHGRRVRDVVNGVSKYSFYSQSGQLAYVKDLRTAKQSNYFYLGGSLVAIREQPDGQAAVALYQHTDALGSPVAVTNAARTVMEKSEYEPYGGLLNRPLEDGPGYTGHVSDAATGLSYMQQRYYDPKIGGGRFLSVDPVTANNVGGNFNRYWYANNNPYRYTDPDGRCPDKNPCHEPTPFNLFRDTFGGRILSSMIGDPIALFRSDSLNPLSDEVRSPGQLEDAKIGLLTFAMPLARAESAIAGSIRNVNVVGGRLNCVNCAIATDSILSGSRASAMPGGPFAIRELERVFGARFGGEASIDAVTQAMRSAGPGARGIIFGSRGAGQVGHVFNVVNQRGTIQFLDGQAGTAASLEGYESFRLLRTNP